MQTRTTYSDWKSLRKAFTKAGHTIEIRRNGHERWNCPNGPVWAASSPSDKRALKNHITMLHKMGADI